MAMSPPISSGSTRLPDFQTSRLPDTPPGPGILAILNCTPDSFSDGGALPTVEAAVAAGRQTIADGADWLDVGGESSRPGADAVPDGVEIARTIPVIRRLRAAGITAPISIDTTKAAVAAAALDAGATVVNDISAGADPAMLPLIAQRRVPVILMHRQGQAKTMQTDPRYADVVGEVITTLSERIAAAVGVGVPRERILADPGIGFGKTVAHNLALLAALSRLRDATGCPLVLGLSRKRFLSAITGTGYPSADGFSHVLHALLGGQCALLRVHDVPGTVTALRAAGLR